MLRLYAQMLARMGCKWSGGEPQHHHCDTHLNRAASKASTPGRKPAKRTDILPTAA